MSYQQKLNPWVVHKLLPNLSQTTVSRFRRRNDAEAYLKVLRQMHPTATFEIAFEAPQANLVTSQAE